MLRTIAILGGALNRMFTGIFPPFVLFGQERPGLGAAGSGLLLAIGAVGGVAGSLTASRRVTFVADASSLR